MYSNILEFKRQQNDILLHTVVLCQDKEDIVKANKWLESQKDILYLPNSDFFAYYCPMCNSILTVGLRCKHCRQLIDWKDNMKPKLISE